MKNKTTIKSGGHGNGHAIHRATHKANCESYRRNRVRERNKLKRIICSNGMKAALEYGQKEGMQDAARHFISKYLENLPAPGARA